MHGTVWRNTMVPDLVAKKKLLAGPVQSRSCTSCRERAGPCKTPGKLQIPENHTGEALVFRGP